MSRRPQPPTVGRIDTARARMAPGGRMWSESPIRTPRQRVAQSGVLVPGTQPIGAVIQDTQARLLAPADASYVCPMDEAPDGVTHAASLICATNYTTITAPAGWDILASNGGIGGGLSQGGPMAWAIAVTTDVALGAAPEWYLTDRARSTQGSTVSCLWAYFIGGSGGSLTVDVGRDAETQYSEFCKSPPGGAQAWVYMNALKGVYNLQSAIDVPGAPGSFGGQYSDGAAAVLAYPREPGNTGQLTEDLTQVLPETALFQWGTIGAYGTPAWQALCVGWKP